MNPEERASRPVEPRSMAVAMSQGSSARESDGRTTTEEAAGAWTAREALAGTGAGATTVPGSQVRAELTLDLASGTAQGPGAA